jgi:hypothetical protein
MPTTEQPNNNSVDNSSAAPARIIMGKDEKALLRLWREKRGEEAPPDLSGVLIVQLGPVTEDLNRRWYDLNTGHRVSDGGKQRPDHARQRVRPSLDRRHTCCGRRPHRQHRRCRLTLPSFRQAISCFIRCGADRSNEQACLWRRRHSQFQRLGLRVAVAVPDR